MRRLGWSFTERIRESHSAWPRDTDEPDLEGADLVVSLGSGWSTYWDDVAVPVLAEQRLIRAALDAAVPVFGICFGAQQLSTVLGGTVSRAARAEIGWCTVDPALESGTGAPAAMFEGPWMQWHYDAFTVPSGATLLAQSEVGPQAFVHHRSVGLQFHPEATESIVAQWSRDEGADELAVVGTDVATLLGETRRELDSARRRCDALMTWVLETAGFGR